LVLVKGDWRKESQFSLTTYSILVLVEGDRQKESQFSLTTYRIWVLVKGDWRMESHFNRPHTTFFFNQMLEIL
jgi:hypothetical protein